MAVALSDADGAGGAVETDGLVSAAEELTVALGATAWSESAG